MINTENFIPAVWSVKLIKEHNTNGRYQINCPQDATKILTQFLADKDREYLVVLMLDNKNRVIGLNVVSIGDINTGLVSVSNIFKPAILANSNQIIISHNHPSGDPLPSLEDIKATRQIAEAGDLLGIEVLDHIIIGDGQSYSLKDYGLF